MSESRFDHPRLIADIGGTFARFALEVEPHVFEQNASLRCADFPDFYAAVTAYISGLSGVTQGVGCLELHVLIDIADRTHRSSLVNGFLDSLGPRELEDRPPTVSVAG